jgi:hypothetical protein
LIIGRRHLETVLDTYTAHYNGERLHRALALLSPDRQTRTRDRAAERSSAATDSAD